MIKILHTADWHLGKKLENFSRMDEQQQVLEEICLLAEAYNVDAVIISGDLYDSSRPATEAEELFYKTLKRLAADGKRAVVAIAGNHDSADRVAVPDLLARECGIFLLGYPDSIIPPVRLETGLAITKSDEGFLEIKLPGHDTPLRIIATPYANEIRLRTYLGTENPEEEMRQILALRWQKTVSQYCDDKGVNILMAHLLMMRKGGEEPEEPEGERSIVFVGGAQAIYSENIPQGVQYVAMGHLHRYQTIDTRPCPVVYSGSPLSYSMSEAGQQKYVLLLEAEAGKDINIVPLPLHAGHKLHRMRFNTIDEAVAWLNDHQEAIVELTMETDTFLTPLERKALADAHPRIIGPIPVVKNTTESSAEPEAKINLEEPVESLFQKYFQSKNGQAPTEDIMKLFHEILNLDEED